jgi:ankyrin repeat protein
MINQACKLGHLEVVRLLLNNKAPIDTWVVRDAACNGHLEIVRSLLQQGAYIDVWTLKNKDSYKKEIRELIETRLNNERASV